MFARAGHEVLVSGSRDPSELAPLADEIGGQTGTAAEAVAFGEVFVFAVPWRLIDAIVPTLGSLDGKIVIDTTNQFGPGGVADLDGRTAAQVNAQRLAGARYTKSFNTLTAAFQAEASQRTGADRVALFLCGDDDEAKKVVVGADRRRGLRARRPRRDGRRRADGGVAPRGLGVRRGVPRARGARGGRGAPRRAPAAANAAVLTLNHPQRGLTLHTRPHNLSCFFH